MTVSSLPGVKYGDSHYRNFERKKISAIKSNKGSFDVNMTLSERACSERAVQPFQILVMISVKVLLT